MYQIALDLGQRLKLYGRKFPICSSEIYLEDLNLHT